MEQEEYINLIIKEAQGTITAQEKELLSKWINTSKENGIVYNEIKFAWSQSDLYKSDVKVDLKQAWDNVDQSISSSKLNVAIKPLTWVLRVAAVLVLILGIQLAYQSLTSNDQIYSTATNEFLEVTLPDGSQVWMNENSELSYDFTKKERTINLIGEAFFDVTHNPDKPFIVHASETETKVLGTEFNIEAYRDQKMVSVSLLEGKVAFNSANNKEVFLNPGEQVKYNELSSTISTDLFGETNFLAWKTGVLNYDKTPLVKVIGEIENYFDKEIELSGDTNESCVFTGNFNQNSFEEVIEILSYTYDMTYEDDNGNFNLVIQNCK